MLTSHIVTGERQMLLYPQIPRAAMPRAAPADATIVPAPWNTVEVTLKGDHIVVLYNGRKMVDAHDSTLASGAIGLQSAHPVDPPGAKVEFRNLKIKRLP